MRVIHTVLFKFDELQENAKEKARDWWRSGGLDYDWWDSIYEDAERIGLKITSFDLGRSQSITGDLCHWPNQICQLIVREHGKDCGTYKLAQDWYSRKHDHNPMSEEEFKKALLEEYWHILDKEYDYINSDEHVDETLRINEYEFTQDGGIS